MIEDLKIRELDTRSGKNGLYMEIWAGGELPDPHHSTSLHRLFPGVVEAWINRGEAVERIMCLEGMIKLVLCDRRDDSPTREEVNEIFLGEFRLREVAVPPGVLRGWKVVGGRPALVLLALQGKQGEGETVGLEEAAVDYDWEIVMQ
ncbi:MAG: hypothetical protein SWK76_15080 [Actinomycetota bacterium]|nr:hypothetical protein [Actinomycetota bacterium]